MSTSLLVILLTLFALCFLVGMLAVEVFGLAGGILAIPIGYWLGEKVAERTWHLW